MWPFKKRTYREIEEMSPEADRWSSLEGDGDHGPVVIRFNESAEEWARHPRLPVRVGFTLPVDEHDAGAADRLDELEEPLRQLVGEAGPAIEVMVVSATTVKEFVFYVEDESAVDALQSQARARFPDHDIQCFGEFDPRWKGYFHWKLD